MSCPTMIKSFAYESAAVLLLLLLSSGVFYWLPPPSWASPGMRVAAYVNGGKDIPYIVLINASDVALKDVRLRLNTHYRAVLDAPIPVAGQRRIALTDFRRKVQFRRRERGTRTSVPPRSMQIKELEVVSQLGRVRLPLQLGSAR